MESGFDRAKMRGTVLLAGIGSMHVRFVQAHAHRYGGIEWVWEEEPDSVWDAENQRAEENREFLQSVGMRKFEEDRDRRELRGILVLTGDGSRRVTEYERWAKYGVPIYLDKPIGLTLEHLAELRKREAVMKVPWVTGSSWRFSKGWPPAAKEEVRELCIQGPWLDRPGREGWCWYGVHGIELLCQMLGDDLRDVLVELTGKTRRLEVRCEGGRAGVLEGDTEEAGHLRITCKRDQGSITKDLFEAGPIKYGRLLDGVMEFFETGRKWYAEKELEALAAVLHCGWLSEQEQKRIPIGPILKNAKTMKGSPSISDE